MNSLRIGLALEMIMVACVGSPAQAQGGVGAIAAGAAVSGVIDDLRRSANDVVTHLGDTVDSSTFRARQQMEVLIGQIDVLAAGTINKTFGELNATERKTFQDIKVGLARLETLQRVTANDVKQITNNASTAIGNLPFARQTPRVTEFGPAYVVSGATPGGGVRVRATGFLLGTGTPQYTIAGRACPLLTKTETAVEFACDPALFRATDRATPVTGQLTVWETPTFWASVRNWFRRAPGPRLYTFSVFAVPPQLGTYHLSAVVTTDEVKTNTRSQDYAEHNGHCAGDRDITVPFNSVGGWTIDPKTISVECNSSSKSSCDGVRGVTDHSFGYQIHVRNSGNCVKVFNNIVSYDARGSVWGTARWTEYQSNPVDSKVELSDGALAWGREQALTLPKGTKATILTVDQIDGRKAVVLGSDSSQPWFDVTEDLAAGTMVVRPKSVTDALR